MPSLSVNWAVGGGMLLKASVMVGCRDAMLNPWGEGLSRRVPQSDAKVSRHRGAMESFIAFGLEILGFRRLYSSWLLDESRVLKYLRA